MTIGTALELANSTVQYSTVYIYSTKETSRTERLERLLEKLGGVRVEVGTGPVRKDHSTDGTSTYKTRNLHGFRAAVIAVFVL